LGQAGGGSGGIESSGTQAENAVANTGGGGGGLRNPTGGGAGGSGLVIIRVAGSFTAADTTGSPSRVESGGFTFYKFTGNGSITL
jgi:hypothetical protein